MSDTHDDWRRAGRIGDRAGESTSDYVARNLGKGDRIERIFMFDSIGWSHLSHELKDQDLPFDLDEIHNRPKDTFRFAAIEGGLDIEQPDDACPLLHDVSVGALSPRNPTLLKAWADVFVRQFKLAIDAGADVICAGEFGFPPFRNNSRERRMLIAELQGLIVKAGRPIFMVPGSCHLQCAKADRRKAPDTVAHENTALVLGGDPRLAASLDESVRHYSKRSASIALGERLLSPRDKSIPIFKTPFGNIAVLICSDAFDLRILFSFLRENCHRQPKAEIVLVPSYNRSDLFDESCLYLSYVANTTVICVNSRRERFPSGVVRSFTAGIERVAIQKAMDRSKGIFEGVSKEESLAMRDFFKYVPVVEDTVPLADGEPRPSVGRGIALYEVDLVRAASLAKFASKKPGPMLKQALAAYDVRRK